MPPRPWAQCCAFRKQRLSAERPISSPTDQSAAERLNRVGAAVQRTRHPNESGATGVARRPTAPGAAASMGGPARPRRWIPCRTRRPCRSRIRRARWQVVRLQRRVVRLPVARRRIPHPVAIRSRAPGAAGWSPRVRPGYQAKARARASPVAMVNHSRWGAEGRRGPWDCRTARPTRARPPPPQPRRRQRSGATPVPPGHPRGVIWLQPHCQLVSPFHGALSMATTVGRRRDLRAPPR